MGGAIETDPTGTITAFPVAGPEGDLARYGTWPRPTANPRYLYYSGHGDLAAEANSLGNRTALYSYDPFGATSQTTLPGNATAERFTGRWNKQLDSSSGLIEMGVRPYDPQLGRFLAVDPIEGGALNNYDYALQDPINVYDLDGLNAYAIQRWGGSPPLSRRAGAMWGFSALAATQVEHLALVWRAAKKAGEKSVPLDKRDKRRYFTPRQKREGAERQDGACRDCGTPLQKPWDGHHERPWAQGGRTSDGNFTGLCQPCHRPRHKP